MIVIKRGCFLVLALALAVCCGEVFAEGFTAASFTAGYSNMTRLVESSLASGAKSKETVTDDLAAIALDVDFVSSLGPQVCFEMLTGYRINVIAQLLPAFGLGYSFNRFHNITLEAALIYSLSPVTTDASYMYTGDGAVGVKAGGTYWFGDLGASVLCDYYGFVLNDTSLWSIRAGVSIKR